MPRGSRRSSGGFGGGFGGFGGGSRAPAAPRRAASPIGGGAPRPAAAPVPVHAPPGGFAPAHYGGYRAPGFGTMVGMGMGVGLGSAAGHALGGMLFGRGSPAETRAQIEEAQAAPRDQCGVELSMFNKCIEKKDTEACAQYYNDVMQCKRVAEGYPPYAATPAPQQGGMVPQAQMGSADNSNMAIQSGDKFY